MRPTLADLTPEQYAAHVELVEATRRLNLAVATTAVDREALQVAAQAVDALTASLSAESTQRVRRSTFTQPGEWARERGEFSINVLNPAHPRINLVLDGDFAAAHEGGELVGLRAHADMVVDSLHEGPPDSVHGGISALLMDCIQGLLVQATQKPAVTGELTTRYLLRTPLDQPIRLTAEITGHRGRAITVEGGVLHEGQETVRAKGLFIQVQPRGRI